MSQHDKKIPLSKRTPQMQVDAIWIFMKNRLTLDQRLEIMSHFCRSCGSDDPRCDCVVRWVESVRDSMKGEGDAS